MPNSTELFAAADDIARFTRSLEGLVVLKDVFRDFGSLIQAAEEARSVTAGVVADRDAAILERDRVQAQIEALRAEAIEALAARDAAVAAKAAAEEKLAALRAKVSP